MKNSSYLEKNKVKLTGGRECQSKKGPFKAKQLDLPYGENYKHKCTKNIFDNERRNIHIEF